VSPARPAPQAAARAALHAEWTKLRTEPGPAWLALAVIAATVALSAAAAAAARCPAGCAAGPAADPAKISLTGVVLGQAVVAVLAVLAVSGEYSTGLIRVTLAAMPRRGAVLAAKATVVTGVVLTAGVLAVLGSVLAGRMILAPPPAPRPPPHSPFTIPPSLSPFSLADGPVLRAAAGSVLYLALIGLLSLGTAAAVRDSATAIGVVLGLLYLFPIAAAGVSNPHWHRLLEQVAPMSAGLAIQATTGLPSLPIGPWAGLGVLAAWAFAAVLAGGLRLALGDA
jgi:ABC-2 type transport system permease protein